MPLAFLINSPQSEQDWSVWSWSHKDQHTLARNAVQAKYGINLADYPIDPIPFQQITQWLDYNQEMHDDINGILGTNSTNLQQVNFRDAAQLSAWIYLHRREHENWANMLGFS
jgi:hypothetical protein